MELLYTESATGADGPALSLIEVAALGKMANDSIGVVLAKLGIAIQSILLVITHHPMAVEFCLYLSEMKERALIIFGKMVTVPMECPVEVKWVARVSSKKVCT